MKAVLIGYGEVGKAIHKAWGKAHDIQINDPFCGCGLDAEEFFEYDLMLVAIPYSDDFKKIVKENQARFRPKATVIFSTVPIGTSSALGACHSPIEARHDARDVMHEYLKKGIRWIGGKNDLVGIFFRRAGLRVVCMNRPEATEFLKLRSLALYAVNIEMARYSANVAYEIGFDYDYLAAYDLDYNQINIDMDLPHLQRQIILDEPDGNIGGHCIIPNTKILAKQFPHPFLRTVLDINGEQLADKGVAWEGETFVEFVKMMNTPNPIIGNLPKLHRSIEEKMNCRERIGNDKKEDPV